MMPDRAPAAKPGARGGAVATATAALSPCRPARRPVSSRPMASTDRSTRRLSLQLFAGALGLMALVTVGEIPLGQLLAWWELDTWLAVGNAVVAAAAVVAVALLLRIDRHARERPRLLFALFAAVVAVTAFAARLLAAVDLLWVGFPARRAMEVVGLLSFDLAIFLITASLIALTPGHRGTRVHELFRTGLAVVVGVASVTVIALFGDFHGALEPGRFLGVATRAVMGVGLVLIAVATLLAMQQLENQQDVVDAF